MDSYEYTRNIRIKHAQDSVNSGVTPWAAIELQIAQLTPDAEPVVVAHMSVKETANGFVVSNSRYPENKKAWPWQRATGVSTAVQIIKRELNNVYPG